MADSVPNYITAAGYKRLVDELVDLRSVKRPKVVDEVSAAAALGDRSENAEYIYGKKKLREIDRRMRFLSERIDAAQVVEIKAQKGREDRIFFGATVTLEGDDGESMEVMLVGVDEIDVERGRVSWRSPVGTACLGKREGDTVRVRTPNGLRTYTVVEVRYRA
jgi:transcription elongation factor GreB